MTSPQAFLTGAILIAAAVILSDGSSAVSQTSSGLGTYMVAAAARDEAAYVMDMVTGSLRYCERQTFFPVQDDGTLNADDPNMIMSCDDWTDVSHYTHRPR